MARRLFPALGILFVARFLFAQEDGNKVLFEALARNDCAVVPLWPRGVGPGETKPQLSEGFQKTPEGTLIFRPVVKSEMLVIPPPPGTRATGVTVLCCPIWRRWPATTTSSEPTTRSTITTASPVGRTPASSCNRPT